MAEEKECERMQQNWELIQEDETATIEEHQAVLFSLLQEFDRVCRKLDISYFLFAGTLLGAVRHQGFIPWDDDLDVLMKREDYTRFLLEGADQLDKECVYLQKEHSEHWPMFFSKLRCNGTTCLEKYHGKDPETHEGVYMDIFPCDHAFDSKAGRLLQFAASKVIIAKGLDARGYETDSVGKKLFMGVCRPLPAGLFRRIVHGPKKQGRYSHSFLGGASSFSKNVYPSEWFNRQVKLPFEDGQYPVPAVYDQVLTALYGDYMQVPPEKDRLCKKHAILVDLKRPYTDYRNFRDGMEFSVHTRSIR